MARLGFYNIRTIECLTREIRISRVGYQEVPKDITELEALRKRDRKSKEKDEAKSQGKLYTSPITDIRGHTGYLTFAIKF